MTKQNKEWLGAIENIAKVQLNNKKQVSPATAIIMQQNLEKCREAYRTMAIRKRNCVYSNEDKKNILHQAFKYQIPYCSIGVDFVDLESKIEEWEKLLEKAEETGVSWEEGEYDILALQSKLENKYEEDLRDKRANYYAYYETRI